PSVRPRFLHFFPTRRSSDLPFPRLFAFRILFAFRRLFPFRNCVPVFRWFHTLVTAGFLRLANGATRLRCGIVATVYGPERVNEPDRKSTRLNSSHLGISYAV